MDKHRPTKDSLKAKSLTCDVCEKSFKSKSSLVIHKRIHYGEKPYKCGVCDKSFTQKGNLIRHTLVHSGKKEFQCDVC